MSGIFGMIGLKIDLQATCKDKGILASWNRAYGLEARYYNNDRVFIGACGDVIAKNATGKALIEYDESIAAFDALIYNRADFSLDRHLNCGGTDGEFLFDFVREKGYGSLVHLHGDFAGAVYDIKDNTITLFRDHMGVRPLFYYCHDGILAFSSDIRGLTGMSCIDATISEDWIYKTLHGYVNYNAVNTEYEHIFCVEPGAYITFYIEENKVPQKHKYWEIGKKKIHFSDDHEYKNRLKDLITNAIKRRADAVSGIGSELSGGLDSGVISILLHRLGYDTKYFSWSLSEEDRPLVDNDERLIIKEICEKEGITCIYSKPGNTLGSDSGIVKAAEHLGLNYENEMIPSFDLALPAYINALTLAETLDNMRRNGASAVFSGHGGDEGVSHRSNPYELFYNHEYYRYFRLMWSRTHGKRLRIWNTLKMSYKNIKDTGKHLKSEFMGAFNATSFISQNFYEANKDRKAPAMHFFYDPVSYIREGGSRLRLDNASLIGGNSGLRYLFPYLDFDVVDFAVSIPRHMYIRGRRNRYIFREAFKDILPNSLYNLNRKESPSNAAIEYEDEATAEAVSKKRREDLQKLREMVVSHLNREYWKKYLDYDKIDAWLKSDIPDDADKQAEIHRVMLTLLFCALAENTVKKSREITVPQEIIDAIAASKN
jgi:asparagine synthase (glutamine-hydrolysing)